MDIALVGQCRRDCAELISITRQIILVDNFRSKLEKARAAMGKDMNGHKARLIFQIIGHLHDFITRRVKKHGCDALILQITHQNLRIIKRAVDESDHMIRCQNAGERRIGGRYRRR